jgi:transmembrane sensor
MASKGEDDSRILDEAALWLVRRDREGPWDEAGFMSWIEESPRHLEVYLEVVELRQMVRGLHRARPPTLARRRMSLAAAVWCGALAVTFSVVSVVSVTMWSAAHRRGLVSAGAPARPVDTFVTAVGEQRSVRLSDGSTMRLNTNTRVTFKSSQKERRVTLSSGGEAMFWVERDPSRPFQVVTGRALVQVLGTEFSVFEAADRSTISVVEGRVRVLPGGAKGGRDESEGQRSPLGRDDSAGAILGAEKQVSVGSDGILSTVVTVRKSELERWLQGKLRFDRATWGEVASALNRYNSQQIVIVDPGLGARQFTGLLGADNPEEFLHILRSEHPEVEVEKTGDSIVIRSR